MVDSGPDDNHAFAFSCLSRVRPFSGKLNNGFGIHSGKNFLPGGSVGGTFIGIIFGIISGQIPIDAILSHDQIINRGNRDFFTLGSFYEANWHTAQRFAI